MSIGFWDAEMDSECLRDFLLLLRLGFVLTLSVHRSRSKFLRLVGIHHRAVMRWMFVIVWPRWAPLGRCVLVGVGDVRIYFHIFFGHEVFAWSK